MKSWLFLEPDKSEVLCVKKFSLILSVLVLFSGCARLPDNSSKAYSTTLSGSWEDWADTELGWQVSAHPDKTGVFLLSDGLDAFTARAALIKMATVGLDVQYYLFHDDMTGTVLASLLVDAADRGVRVRLLVDDMGLSGRDHSIQLLDSHPNINIRIFNPFSRSKARMMQMLTRFGSVTRRMHNKSLTADNLLSIVGGRNIGDEYFSANPVVEFGDLDVLVAGDIVSQVSDSFDEYWNSSYSYPIALLTGDVDLAEFNEKQDGLKSQYLKAKKSKYAEELQATDLVQKTSEALKRFDWVDADVFSDPPKKISDSTRANPVSILSDVMGSLSDMENELLIISPYFVPGKEGVAFFKALVKRGVRVRILTNSLASNDVKIVHGGYAKYRKSLLRAGAELYELSSKLSKKMKKKKGGSRASLHAKSFIMDRTKIFIGSLNLDPRSVVENTEIGIVFTSSKYGEEIGRNFDEEIGASAFQLKLVDGDIQWIEKRGEKEIIHTTEPHTSFWDRASVWLLSLLPVESQL